MRNVYVAPSGTGLAIAPSVSREETQLGFYSRSKQPQAEYIQPSLVASRAALSTCVRNPNIIFFWNLAIQMPKLAKLSVSKKKTYNIGVSGCTTGQPTSYPRSQW